MYVGVVWLFYEIKGGRGIMLLENKVHRSLSGRKTKKKQYAACFEKLVKTGKIVRLQIHFNEFGFFALNSTSSIGCFRKHWRLLCKQTT